MLLMDLMYVCMYVVDVCMRVRLLGIYVYKLCAHVLMCYVDLCMYGMYVCM